MQSPSLITCHKVRNFPWFMPDDDPDMGGIRVASIDHCGSWCWHWSGVEEGHEKKPPPSLCCLQGGGNVLDWRQVPGCMELESEGEVTAEHFPSRNNVLMKWEPLEELPAFCFCTCPLKWDVKNGHCGVLASEVFQHSELAFKLRSQGWAVVFPFCACVVASLLPCTLCSF